MRCKPHSAAIAIALSALAATSAEARHSCGTSTKVVGNCTYTTTSLCEYQVVGGKRQEVLVGVQRSKTCTEDATRTGPKRAGGASGVINRVPNARQ